MAPRVQEVFDVYKAYLENIALVMNGMRLKEWFVIDASGRKQQSVVKWIDRDGDVLVQDVLLVDIMRGWPIWC